jgi:hypothetical protein
MYLCCLTAFGGSNGSKYIFQIINSSRLELMDESSLVPKETDRCAWSPLCVLNNVLLQVIRVPDVDPDSLWIPEDIRSKMLFVDDHVDIAERFVPQHSCVNCSRLESVSLAQASGLLFGDWRDCDGKSFAALKLVVDSMLTTEYIVEDDVLLLGQGHVQDEMRQLVEALNTHLFAELRSIARKCWKPLLWTTAVALQSFDDVLNFFHSAESPGECPCVGGAYVRAPPLCL